MLRPITPLLALALLPALAAAQPVTTPFTLLCGRYPEETRTLKVDPAAHTVDDVDAKFTDVDITWRTNDPSRNLILDHRLDRLTGSYSRTLVRGPFVTLPTLLCEKAPPPKF